jgi:NADPH:quinone reductase-like Zn-dependent oxidoreductase
MRAVVHDRYGPPDVLRLDDVERPVPKPDEILVRIRATTVNRTDCHRRAADSFAWRLIAGLRPPATFPASRCSQRETGWCHAGGHE